MSTEQPSNNAQPQEQKDLLTVFKSFDKDGNGFIDLSELQSIAIQLNSDISNEQAATIIQELDVNGDGKIEFEEFQYWWEKGHKGKLSKLVYFKAKTMKMTNHFINELKSSGVTLEGYEHEDNTDQCRVELHYGQQTGEGLKIHFATYQQGEKFNYQLSQLKDKIKEYNQDSINIVLVCPTQNPDKTKNQLQDLLKDVFSGMMPFQIEDFQNNPYLNLKSHLFQNCIYFHIEVNQQIANMFIGPISLFDQAAKIFGDKFFVNIETEIQTNFSCTDLLEKETIFENLLKGFSFKFRHEVTSTLMKKLRLLLQTKLLKAGKIDKILPLLMRKLNFKLKIKTPEKLDAFFQKLGIKDLIHQCPNLQDVLEQFSVIPQVQAIKHEKQSPFHMLYKFLHFCNKNLQSGIKIFVQRKNIITKVETNFEGASKIYKTVFNEA